MRETGASIYVSTSTRFEIALDHALNGRGFFDKIKSRGGIDVVSWGKTVPTFELESEVLFSRDIPRESIVRYCVATHAAMPDDFVDL
ncbi:hypothetical protein D3C71_1117330 [compost metagenome]